MCVRKMLSFLLVVVLVIVMIPSAAASEVTTEEPYWIVVDGIQFASNVEMSDDTWSYDPSDCSLTLNNYNGAEIVASGDLTIWSFGETTVQGDQWHGISNAGNLTVYCVRGSLTVQGGAAPTNKHGYAAVYSEGELSITPAKGTTINLTGGACDQEGYSGGHAVYAPSVFFTNKGHINATGGAASAPATQGGYAVYTDKFYGYADCTLIGGSGATLVPAVYSYTYCGFGHVNATILASGAGRSAFDGANTLYVDYADVEISDDYSEWTITARDYTLTLDGNGGTCDGEESVVLDDVFTGTVTPDEIDLSAYEFVQEGYVLTGWELEDGTILEVDEIYEPEFDPGSAEETNITLTAVWREATDEDRSVIWVDGAKIYADEEASGDTWSYTPNKNTLTLNNYNGAEIISEVDLNIYTYGENVIRGNFWDGICSFESVAIFCMDGSLTVTGGDAPSEDFGYCAIYAEDDVSCYAIGEDTVINLVGGSCDQEGCCGGDAVWATVVTFMGNGQINAVGGAASTPTEFGGYAVYADKFYLGTDGTLKGGSGSSVTSAIYVEEYCSIRRITATIEASGTGTSAFDGDGAIYIEYADYVRTEDHSKWEITPRNYTLTLDGAGGNRDGQESVVHDVTFSLKISPDNVALSSYGFTRLGYKQTGWQTSDGTAIELNAVYELPLNPTSAEDTNVTLSAVWEYVGPEVDVSEGVLTAVIPGGWCEENAVSKVMLALYTEGGQMIWCEMQTWTEGSDITFEHDLTDTDTYMYRVFFLDAENTPVLEQLEDEDF